MKRALLLALLLCIPAAMAHAELQSSEPAAGTRLDQAPHHVRVVLTEPVDPAGTSLAVTDSDGDRVDRGDLELEPGPFPVLTVTLPGDLSDGAYSARWQALSTVDGHTTSGSIGFAVGEHTPPATTEDRGGAWDLPSAAARLVAFVGLAVVVGALTTTWWAPAVAGPGWLALRRTLLAAGSLVHLAGVASLFLDGMADNGHTASAFAATAPGRLLVLRLQVAAGMAALALLWWQRPVRIAHAILGVGVLAAAYLSASLGHASQDGPVAVVLDATHLVASAYWVGALAMLGLVLARCGSLGLTREALHGIGARFGTLAASAVVLIAATGSIVAFEILESLLLHPAQWIPTPWGIVLVAKLAGIAAMVLLALRNRRLYVQDSGGSRGPAHPGFMRTVAAEAALGVVVLALAGLLTSVGAPQAAAESGQTLELQGDAFHGSLTVQPEAQTGGTSRISLFLQDEDGPLEDLACGRDACVTVRIEVPGEGTTTWVPDARGAGEWLVHDVIWTRAGAHDVTVEVQSAEVYRDVLRTVVVVQA